MKPFGQAKGEAVPPPVESGWWLVPRGLAAVAIAGTIAGGLRFYQWLRASKSSASTGEGDGYRPLIDEELLGPELTIIEGELSEPSNTEAAPHPLEPVDQARDTA